MMKITKSTRRTIGWLVSLGAVAGLVQGVYSVHSPLFGLFSDFAATLALAAGMMLIVA